MIAFINCSMLREKIAGVSRICQHWLQLAFMKMKHHSTSGRLQLSVYRSLSIDPYVNLAFEDWLHETQDFDHKKILFLWRNEPCIVIGRHQNPWKECNFDLMREKGVHLARRKSGGGAVYHDLGNVNCTFFTSRSDYDRRSNLEFLVRTLRKCWQVQVHVNKRDDIILNEAFKVSGTAAKLGLKKAYHHFTLLCDVDLSNLTHLLVSPYDGLKSNATASLSSETKNIFSSQVRVPFCWDNFTTTLAKEFFYDYGIHQFSITDIHPLKMNYSSDILHFKNSISSWDWIYGNTPKFTVTKEHCFNFGRIRIHITIAKGLINCISCEADNVSVEVQANLLLECLRDQQFWHSAALGALSQYLKLQEGKTNFKIDSQISHWLLSFIP